MTETFILLFLIVLIVGAGAALGVAVLAIVLIEALARGTEAIWRRIR